MTELKEYVDGLFRHQYLTPEVKDLKEEILSNMLAKRDDLISQGLDAVSATEKAKESLSAIDDLIDGNQLTDVGSYRLECMQTVLLNCIIFWIGSLPLLLIGYPLFCYMGILFVIISGCVYLAGRKPLYNTVAFLSVTASKRRRKTVWIIWGLFFFVTAGTIAALTFGSNIWFNRPVEIDGPYQMANIALRFYKPLLTILIPITFNSFTRLLLKNGKEHENEQKK